MLLDDSPLPQCDNDFEDDQFDDDDDDDDDDDSDITSSEYERFYYILKLSPFIALF